MIKKGTITQFDEIQVSIATGIADRFDYHEAYTDYVNSQTRKPTVDQAAFTWFLAGIIIGRENTFDAVREFINEKDI